MTTARRLAWECLQRIDHEGAYANLVVPARLAGSGLDQRDRAFVTDLVYGSTRLRRALDASIDRFVTRAPDPSTRSLLRLGAYQVMFAGTAAHAAVGETVALASPRTRGFVNAVLRSISRSPMQWPNSAVELSYPDWIVERLSGELGAERAVATLRAMNRPASAQARPDGYVQDPGSRLVVDAVEARPGERILETEIAARLKVSRVPVREAFKILTTQGILQGEPHRGLSVIEVNEKVINEICDARIAVETLAVRSLRADPDRISQLAPVLAGKIAILAQKIRIGDLVAINHADIDFHRQICELSGNRIATTLWQAIARHIWIVFGWEIRSETSISRMVEQHGRQADQRAPREGRLGREMGPIDVHDVHTSFRGQNCSYRVSSSASTRTSAIE
mgnify:CR=1 FL=1